MNPMLGIMVDLNEQIPEDALMNPMLGIMVDLNETNTGRCSYESYVMHHGGLGLLGNNNNNNNCLKSNIQCIEIRVQWTVHLGSSHMHRKGYTPLAKSVCKHSLNALVRMFDTLGLHVINVRLGGVKFQELTLTFT